MFLCNQLLVLPQQRTDRRFLAQQELFLKLRSRLKIVLTIFFANFHRHDRTSARIWRTASVARFFIFHLIN